MITRARPWSSGTVSDDRTVKICHELATTDICSGWPQNQYPGRTPGVVRFPQLENGEFCRRWGARSICYDRPVSLRVFLVTPLLAREAAINGTIFSKQYLRGAACCHVVGG